MKAEIPNLHKSKFKLNSSADSRRLETKARPIIPPPLHSRFPTQHLENRWHITAATSPAALITASRAKGQCAPVSDSLASRMNRTQWMREQAWVTMSGAASRLQRPGSCRARQQQSRPACRSRLSGTRAWIRCHDSACGVGRVKEGPLPRSAPGPTGGHVQTSLRSHGSGPPLPAPPV